MRCFLLLRAIIGHKRTNEIANYIAFAFVYGYNENEMTVDNAEVNLLKVKLNQSCGKAKM